jgi:hypothetical protein
VTVVDLDGVRHAVTVEGDSLYEAAAAALAAFRQEPWAAAALTPTATLHVEVHSPATMHAVPLKALERWKRSPSASPKEFVTKRRHGGEQR